MNPTPRVMAAVLIASLCGGTLRASQAPETGRETFQTLCAACHTIGGGRLVGPDLQGLADRRSEAWIIEFVQHSQKLVAAGDSTAVALFKEYGEMPMPDQALSADEVRGVIAYIRGAAPPAAAAAAPVTAATEEQILLGRNLFQGKARFANGGPTCTSCHDVTADGVAGGGALARELTTAVARLGSAGVRGIVSAPPFPVMQRAYRDRPLVEAEVVALVGFLEQVSAQQATHRSRSLVPKLIAAGVGGSVLLLLLYTLVWGGRLKGSVNRSIYDRQLKST